MKKVLCITLALFSTLSIVLLPASAMSQAYVTAAFGLPYKNEEILEVPVTNPGKTFPDIDGHKYQEAIEGLASRNIVDGMGDGMFQPDGTMIRAQFCALVIRALGMTPMTTNDFTDVPSSAWYAGYVGKASNADLVSGRGSGIFDPNGLITRQEAAKMIATVAGRAGTYTGNHEATVLFALNEYKDGGEVADWAEEPIVYCLKKDIIVMDGDYLYPTEPVTRGELTYMLHTAMKVLMLIDYD